MYEYYRIGLGQGRVTLSVDNLRRQSAVGGVAGAGAGAGELRLGNSTANSYVYLGGLPPWYSGKLTSLALPSVVFEPRLRGEVSLRLLKILRKLPFIPSIIFYRQVRNVVYADTEGAGVRHQRMMAYTVSTVQYSTVQYSTVQYSTV